MILRAGLGAQQDADDAVEDLAQLEALVGGLSEGVMVLEASGRSLLMNSAARLITKNVGGTGAADQPLEVQWQDPDGRPVELSDWPPRRALRGEQFTDVELVGVVPGASGSVRATFSGSSVLDADGKVALAIITLRDVTELRRLERLREEYFALISHDLRNPLAIVLLATERLASEAISDGDEERSEIIELVLTSVQRMEAMLQELLEGGFLESGDLPMTMEPISPVRLITALVDRMGSGRLDRQIDLLCPMEVEPIVGDAGQIERVVTNLLSNAIRYSESGTPIAVTLVADGDQVTVSVRDAGRGISVEDLPHIFERAYRAGSVGRREPGSFGLGLYIANRIVEDHGGRIWAESEVGVGTTVSFSLPTGGQAAPED
ncbi:MAG: ATP-binding protein [Tepidiformaceae bacterium]